MYLIQSSFGYHPVIIIAFLAVLFVLSAKFWGSIGTFAGRYVAACKKKPFYSIVPLLVLMCFWFALAIWKSAGEKVGSPTMFFGEVVSASYYPAEAWEKTGFRDETILRYKIGPFSQGEDTMELCGDQTATFAARKFYRMMLQVYEIKVPYTNGLSTTRRCIRATGIESWDASGQRRDIVTGFMDSVRPASDDKTRSIEINVRDSNSSQVLQICRDGYVKRLLDEYSNMNVQLEYFGLMRSSLVQCFPLADIEFNTSMGALHASTDRSAVIIRALASPPPRKLPIPPDFRSDFRTQTGQEFTSPAAIVIQLRSEGNVGIYLVSQDPDFCGSGGCSAVLWAKVNDRYEPVLDSLGFDIRALDEETLGWHNVVVSGGHSATVYQFDGQRYVESECYITVGNEDLVPANCSQ